MKNIKSETPVLLYSAAQNGTEISEYRWGADSIRVSRFRSLLSGEKCVVIAFGRGLHSKSRKIDIARYFGADLNSCCFDGSAIYGKAI